GGDASTNQSLAEPASAPEADFVAAKTLPATEFEGVWKSGCIAVDLPRSAIVTFQFTGGFVTLTTANYDDYNCLGASVVRVGYRSFEIVGDSTAIEGAKSIDYTHLSTTLKPLTKEYVNALNKVGNMRVL